MFIVKLTKIVKENITYIAQVYKLITEIKSYFELKEVALHINNVVSNQELISFEFTPIYKEKLTDDFDLNDSLRTNKYSFQEAVTADSFFIINKKFKDKNIQYLIFPLVKARQIIGILVVLPSIKTEFDSEDLATFKIACSLLEIFLQDEYSVI